MSSRRTTHTQQLLEQMSTAMIPVEEAERAEARRQRVVARLESLHEKLDDKKQRAQRRTRRIAMLSAAAAPLLAVGGYWLARHTGVPARGPSASVARATAGPVPPRSAAGVAPARITVQSGSVLLARGADERPVRDSERLLQDDRIYTGGSGHARVHVQSGTDVDMAPVTELTMGTEAAGWRSASVDLARGRVDVSVRQLPPGGSFSVVTPDARVEVQAAHFTVIYEPDANGTPTAHVQVQDGKVVVRAHGTSTTLGRGADWSSAPEMADAHTAAPTRARAAEPAHRAKDNPPGKAKSRPALPAIRSAGATKTPDVTSASSLAEQNRLFQAAMDARRGGQNARALTLLDQLLARYPGSPLEQDARVERFRALERLGRRAEATHAARRYLADHPEGFARDEARRIAIDPDGG